jgi:lipoprotein-anchoring transpeptidase ErfK/SrfK
MAYSIIVDLSARELNLYLNGNLANSFPIGIGKMLTPTPTGTYSIVNKEPNPGGPFGAMWMGLSRPTYGIHGTNNPASIGHIVSHGCIRMYNRDVIELSQLVPLGTPVTIVNK